MQTLSPLSTEFIRVPVAAMGYTVTQIKACTVTMALVPSGYEPSVGDFQAAAWASGNVPYAILLVGPGANIMLSGATSYDVWVKITTPAPVAPATTPISYIAVVRSGTLRTHAGSSTSVLPPAQFDQRAKIVNLGVTLGDDLIVPFVIKENGVNYVWTGAVVEGQIRATETSSTILMTFTFDTSVNGRLVASLTETQVAQLGVGNPYYSIRITKNAITRTWVKGQIVISPAATQ
jgi:hypothetical protein